MRSKREPCDSLLLPHNGLGAPRARPPERSGDRGAPRATAKGGPRGRSPPDLVRQMRVLLVEDEPNAAHVLAKGLREHAYAVDLAADGETALFQAGTTEYDAVILDVMLPRKDGFAVCREIRESGCP